MFNFFKKAQVEKVDLESVAQIMSSRYWEAEKNGENSIIVHGKYRNNRRDFHKLFLKFVGGNVKFEDARGAVISVVPKNEMYPELKNIMNVL